MDPGEREVTLSGQLFGKRCQIDTILKDLPWGERGEFRVDDAVGEISWVDSRDGRGPKRLRLVVSEPSVSGRPRESTGWTTQLGCYADLPEGWPDD